MVTNWTRRGGELYVVVVVLVGCASRPRPDDLNAEVATYQLPQRPAEGEAIVYGVRPSAYFGSGRLTVFLDMQDPPAEMGSTTGEQDIYFRLSPGEHTIFSHGENWAEPRVAAQAGEILFVQQDAAMPLLRGARTTLARLSEAEGKYRVKTLTWGTLPAPTERPVATAPSQADPQSRATHATFPGTITGGHYAKAVGFSNLNVKLEVTADTGERAIFDVRSDARGVDAGGKPLAYLVASRGNGQRVESEYFTITDGTGGDPARTDFAFEIGEKGLRVLRFLP